MTFLPTEPPGWVLADGFQFALKESTLSGTIICLILFVLSCFSWAVMVTKFRMLRRASRESREFLGLYRRGRSPFALYEEGNRFAGSPVYAVYQAGCREASFHLMGSSEVDETFRARLQRAGKMNPAEMDSVRVAMERAAGEMMLKLESQMSLLATAVSGAPFLGLLGTVWGVMDTFGGVAVAEGATSLKSMAPGVSAALVTTVIGLLVAIPAMFGYNYLVNSIKNLLIQLENFAAELSGGLERRHVSFHSAAHPAAPAGVIAPDDDAARDALPSLASMGHPRTSFDDDAELDGSDAVPAPVGQRRPRTRRSPSAPQSELDFSTASEAG